MNELATLYAKNSALFLGMLAAAIMFGIVLALFVNSRQRSRAAHDKAPLVDNEVSANVDAERLTIHV